MTRSRKTKPVPPKAKKRRGRTVEPRQPKLPVKIIERLDWQGITLSVSYEPDWLGLAAKFGDVSNAHLEIEALSPKRSVLPITDTGYRSQFLSRQLVERAGGPIAYARAWLDDAAKAPAWKRREEASRQLSLF